MSATARLAIPLLSPGQAQKEAVHNEAIQALEILAAPSVVEPPRNSPPASPSIGACYIVDNSPAGAWAGRSGCLACYTAGGWRFIEPREGLLAYVASTEMWGVVRENMWEFGIFRGSALLVNGQQVVGPRVPAVGAPTGGSTVDAEARTTIGQILSALRQHGLIET